MFKVRAFIIALPLLLFSLSIGYKANAQGILFQNGSFETGDFTGWTVVQYPDSAGDWFVYSGNDFDPLPPPPDGNFAAVTAQRGISSQVLYQDINVPTHTTTQCSATIYYNNPEPITLSLDSNTVNRLFVTGPDLSPLGNDNQQARIDIMDPAADPFDVGAGVYMNIYQTQPGDPDTLGYTTITFDLSDFAGTTVRFRVAEVDNLGIFNFAIDDIHCDIQPANFIPTLSEWGMMAMAAGLGILGMFFVIRRKKAMA